LFPSVGSEYEFNQVLYGFVTPAKFKFGHDIKKHPEKIVATMQQIIQNCIVPEQFNFNFFVK